MDIAQLVNEGWCAESNLQNHVFQIFIFFSKKKKSQFFCSFNIFAFITERESLDPVKRSNLKKRRATIKETLNGVVKYLTESDPDGLKAFKEWQVRKEN